MRKVTDKSGGDAPSGPVGQAGDGAGRGRREFRRSSLERRSLPPGPCHHPQALKGSPGHSEQEHLCP